MIITIIFPEMEYFQLEMGQNDEEEGFFSDYYKK